jgi:hypothetical protein
MAIHGGLDPTGTKPGLQADWYFFNMPAKGVEMNRF